MANEVLESVKSKYGAVAESTLSTNDEGVRAVAEAFGYSAEELTSIPAEANMGLSCGNPTATANIRPGEVVVDLGSGGGLDVFLAARMVGPTGRAIGIDMTPSMIERARENAAKGGYTNVEFCQSTIDRIPLPDDSVDCVISNCVINLAPDKQAVFQEIARVLKPGGRVAISDIALKEELPEAVAKSMAAYVGCIAGAVLMEDYRNGLAKAGLEHIQIIDSGADLNAYAKVENQSGCCSPAMDGDNATSCCALTAASFHEELTEVLSTYDVNQGAASVKIYALKPSGQACCGPNCCS
ncbi:MAG: arsenite methyltransferase [Acidobacteria bacterium]|jgi:SAM-dependent methyltransferase|uniref:arsenite methyltransferase n=1 Tax=Edaphobacter flagellatus TaxID=1933044 RepID=UPI001D43924C|nr:arsenite methyltransferase [Edaphobacter flagellatus]MBS1815465.1 arsenite methyltransferase [Acidobacteriota bacterium]